MVISARHNSAESPIRAFVIALEFAKINACAHTPTHTYICILVHADVRAMRCNNVASHKNERINNNIANICTL